MPKVTISADEAKTALKVYAFNKYKDVIGVENLLSIDVLVNTVEEKFGTEICSIEFSKTGEFIS